MRNFSFKIFPKNKLIIEQYIGAFSSPIHEFEKLKKEEFNHPDFDPNFDILIDLREASYETKNRNPDKTIMPVTDFLKLNKDKIGKRRSAFIAIDPDQVVGSIFYSNLIEGLPIITKIFTTVIAALDWLEIRNKKNILEYLK